MRWSPSRWRTDVPVRPSTGVLRACRTPFSVLLVVVRTLDYAKVASRVEMTQRGKQSCRFELSLPQKTSLDVSV